MEKEFIIVLTEHRHLGAVFIPCLIYRNGPFYSVSSLVKYQRLAEYDYSFSPQETELVRLSDNYSDEKLAKRYAREKNVSEFFSQLAPDYFQKHIAPQIEKSLFACVKILMKEGNIRLFKKDARYANLYDEDIIGVNSGFADAVFNFERNDSETRYRLQLFQDGKPVSLFYKNIRIIANNPCIFILDNRLYVSESLDAKKLVPFFSKEFIPVPRAAEQKYFETFVLNAVRENKVEAKGFRIVEDDSVKKAVLTIEPNLKCEPVFMLRFYYGNELFLPGSQKQAVVNLKQEDGSYSFYKTIRDFFWESQVKTILADTGLSEKNGQYLPRGSEMLDAASLLYFLLNWVNQNKPNLNSHGIEVTQQNLGKTYFTGQQEMETKIESTSDWFDVFTKVRFGEFEIPFYKLRKYILNGEREFELPNGEIAILPEEWLARYRGILPFARHDNESLRLGKFHFPLLKNIHLQPGNDILERIKSIEQPQQSGIPAPSNLKARLRPYQEEGFNWLFSLYRNNFGGCLADDMGLGKTLQTLALLLKLKRKNMPVVTPDFFSENGQLSLFGNPSYAVDEVQPASLIVLPTSLVHNWENEIKKFAPSLKTFKYTGTQRKKMENIGASANFYDIILTTYGTLRNDIKLFSDIDFFYLILDESQYIKNPASKTYKAVSKIRSKHRLVLTGTPIENSLSDLWSQLNFLNKGMLGSLAFFRQNFITPIEKHNDKDIQEKLQAMIRPFILRRAKNQVAHDLPPIMEQVVYCPMLPEQLAQYEEEKSVIRNSILERIDADGVEKSSLLVLQGLARLRQLSNHPQMLDRVSNHGSGKFEEIFRILENLLSENHKVLVFSSFVKHLELIRIKIESLGLKYSLLTGSTTNREEVINCFQNDDENRIFLISLKAGGVGLNLTSADYVFILDPWWNPAAEMQAVSRAHRIGQEKHVFVYRFITEDSIEEKIQQLKSRKSALADKFVNSNNPFKEITKEEILNLFK